MSQMKNPNHRGCDGSGSRQPLRPCSTDKHLILSVRLINGLRHWRYENLEAAAEARHNRGQLARRLDHFRLHEVSRQRDLLVRAIYSAAHEFDLVARLNRRITNQSLQLDDLVLD